MTTEVQNTVCSTDEMAEILGLSERRLQQLSADGWLLGKIGQNRWHLSQTVQSWIQHVQLERLAGRPR